MKISLPNYEKWRAKNPASFNLHSYLLGALNENEHAGEIMYAIFQIIWPQFVEVEGCVFLKEKYSETDYRGLKARVSSVAELEYWTNLLSIEELLPSGSEDVGRALTAELVEVWRCKLNRDFPQKRFEVRTLEDEGTSYIVFTQRP